MSHYANCRSGVRTAHPRVNSTIRAADAALGAAQLTANAQAASANARSDGLASLQTIMGDPDGASSPGALLAALVVLSLAAGLAAELSGRRGPLEAVMARLSRAGGERAVGGR